MADLITSSAMAEQMSGPESGPLRAAMTAAAILVLNEPEDQPDHHARVELAKRVLRGGVTDSFAWAVATNTAVVDRWTSGDTEGAWSDVPYVLTTVWDALANSL